MYGIEEDKHYPIKHDAGFDPEDISKEWVEQVINSLVHPKIDGLRINQIALRQGSIGRVLCAVSIPAATSRAPHQADDKRYYKRYNFQSVPMEDYEIRDIYRRASTPDLWIDFRFNTGKATEVRFKPSTEVSDPIWLYARIGNRSREPALYAALQIYLDQNFAIRAAAPGFRQGAPVTTDDRRHLTPFLKTWSIQQNDLPV